MSTKLLAPESSALARPSGETDYQSFCAALGTSARGREFLAEYTRRNRNADTEMLLTAIDRLEALMRADGTALDRLRDELRLLLIAIRLGRPDIDAASPLTKAAKLASLLDMLELRIETMVEARPGETMPRAEIPRADEPEPAPAMLTVVPPPDEPELPIPSPASVAQPAIALVTSAAAMPDITFIEKAPPKAAVAEGEAEALVVEPVAPVPPVAPAPAARPDALAAIMAMSEAERIALFT